MMVQRICDHTLTMHEVVDGKVEPASEQECGWFGTVELMDNEQASHSFKTWTCDGCGAEHIENDPLNDRDD